MENIILKTQELTKKYKGGVVALENFSVEIQKGRIVGLLGPNGSGKTTLVKMAAGLLTPTSGEITIDGMPVGVETKKLVSYLPERTYFESWMKAQDCISFFADFYEDFDTVKAKSMLKDLSIAENASLRTMSKGTLEKMQLIMVMSRAAAIYLLDEPIGGVDPAARDYILSTILTNYSDNAALVISTHLISDVEKILDDVLFIRSGHLVLSSSVNELRQSNGASVDEYFREVFKC